MNNKGFTLIELLLYVALASIMLGAISIFMSNMLSARIKNQTIMEVENQGMLTTRRIEQAIRNANSINSPTLGTLAGNLSLAMASSTISPTVFSVSGNVLSIQEGVGSAVQLTNSRVRIIGLNFLNASLADTPGSLKFQFTISAVTTTGRFEQNYSRIFYGSASLR